MKRILKTKYADIVVDYITSIEIIENSKEEQKKDGLQYLVVVHTLSGVRFATSEPLNTREEAENEKIRVEEICGFYEGKKTPTFEEDEDYSPEAPILCKGDWSDNTVYEGDTK